MDVVVGLPKGGWQDEKRYVAELMFNDFLGLPVKIKADDSSGWSIRVNNCNFLFPNIFFPEENPDYWLNNLHLDSIKVRSVSSEKLGLNGVKDINVLWAKSEVTALTDIDVFGTIFFFLSRYEEAVSLSRDELCRFPLNASVISKENMFLRPMVDEYLELLKDLMSKCLPRIRFTNHHFRLLLSHDVDIVSSWPNKNFSSLIPRIAGDILKRRKLADACRSFSSFWDESKDKANNFEWIMSLSEKFGLKSSFYFISNGHYFRDTPYKLDSEFIKKLLKNIDSRGHEIGFHAGFDTYNDPGLYFEELEHFRQISPQEVLGGRQHYLRFEIPTTWSIWNKAGMKYESSLGFVEKPGFRCGTCREYSVFDLRTSKKLQLRERPLVLMEHSMLHQTSMGLSHEAAYDYACDLIRIVKRFNGDFTFLWHNHNLISDVDRNLYQELIRFALR